MRFRPSFLNIRGIVTLIVILTIVDLGTAFALAPWLTNFVQNQVNAYSKVKVSIGNVRFHPVLLSFGISGVELYDPEKGTRFFRADHASARLSPMVLLSRRIGFSQMAFENVELEAVKDATGKYNFEAGEAKPDRFALVKQMVTRENVDLYGKLYEKFKWLTRMNRRMKEKAKEPRQAAVRELPRGRVIRFEAEGDPIFEVTRFELKNGTFVLKEKGADVPPFRQVYVLLTNLKIFRSNEIGFNELEARGKFEGEKKGWFDLNANQKKETVTVNAKVKNLDLRAFGPVYEYSLPVSFERGFATLRSKSRIEGETLHSENNLKLEDHLIVAKKKFGLFADVSQPVVDALNKRQTFEMNFQISGTPDKPSFSGFEQVLMDLLKTDLQNIAAASLKGQASQKLSQFLDKFKQ